jgi:ubiquitin thioesterase protein OTUB1
MLLTLNTGDGNCFYRAFLFAYLEELLSLHHSGDEADAVLERDRMLSIARNSKDQLIALGYEEVAFDIFLDLFVELLEGLFSLNADQLLADFQDYQSSGQADHYTWYMRLLTAGAIRGQAARFLPFVSDDVNVAAAVANPDDELEVAAAMARYCRQEVEPMGRECEQVHIIALAELLNVVIMIEYLDGRSFDTSTGLSSIVFNEGDSEAAGSGDKGKRRKSSYFGKHPVTLLYRPGHFDILYRK